MRNMLIASLFALLLAGCSLGCSESSRSPSQEPTQDTESGQDGSDQNADSQTEEQENISANGQSDSIVDEAEEDTLAETATGGDIPDAETVDSIGESDGGSVGADTVQKITEDGGISGSGIYPPKEPPEVLGGERPAKVFVPLDYSSDKQYPLVFSFHGYGGNSVQIDNYFKLSAYVSSRQFILIVPDGLPDLELKQFWNTPDCCDIYGNEPDDLGYILSLVDEAKEKLGVKANQIYAMGLSNGGFLSHYLACEASETFAGIASLAGVMPKSPALCAPSSGVSVLQIHGTLDAVVPFGGSFTFKSVEETVASWQAINQCDVDEVTFADPVNYDYVISGPETEKQEWKACGTGNHVALWKMVNSAHVPFLHPDFGPDVLDWLFSQSKP